MDQNTSFPTFPMHFRGLLLLAGMYTIAWSAFYKWFGPELLKWMSMGDGELAALPSNYFGTFGILIGLVIFVSAFYPVSWVWLILGGVTGKIITAIWFTLGFAPELSWNKRSIFHLVFNELIWLVPLILIFLRGLQVKNFLQEEETKA
jgi:uncharacterized membrane protein